MTKGKDTRKKLAGLEQVLDTYGADPARWPSSGRAAFEAFAQTHPDARRLLDEAQALEQVMGAAPAPEVSHALKARIVAAAVNDPEREAQVVPITHATQRTGTPSSAQRVTSMWPAAALAASFAFGLYLGVSGIGGQAFEGALHIAAINGTGGDPEAVFLLEDSGGAYAEDLL